MDQRLGTVFTTFQAHAAGLSANQLRGARFSRVCQGVYTTGDPTDTMIQARAALLVAGPDALLGGLSVLRALDVWLPVSSLADQRVGVVLPSGRLGPGTDMIRVIRSPIVLEPIDFDDIMAVHPAQAWLQIACDVALDDLIVAADCLMRRKATLATRSEIELMLRRMAGRRGVAKARRALGQARESVESPQETRLRLALVAAGLPCPLIDHEIRPRPGTKVYRLDMAYPDAKLAVEYDGEVHARTAQRMQDDRTRRREIEDAGWRIITATAADWADLSPLIASIRAALQQRSAKRSAPSTNSPR